MKVHLLFVLRIAITIICRRNLINNFPIDLNLNIFSVTITTEEIIMKKFYAYAFFAVVLLLSACEQNNTAQNNTNATVNQNTQTKKTDNGLISLKSQNNFDETYARLKKAIEGNDALKIVAELDHANNATKVEMKLRPTKLIIFGNPKLGSPLMNENQTIGIDLPQKFLVYENDKSEVFVAYNDPMYLAKRHNLDEKREELSKMSNALKGLAEAATR